jgi:hypothetical protein
MKYSQWIGVAAALLLIGACFMPWAFFPDIQKDFTGFYSEKNVYGKPGKVLIFFCLIQLVLFLFPKLWAKRANILVSAMTIAFAVKSYILYTACYKGICPEKKVGIFLVLFTAVLMLVMSCLPNIAVKEETDRG